VNPYSAYRKADPFAGCTRIDLLLSLFDGALDRLDRAETAIRIGDGAAATILLSRAQLIIAELAAGVRLEGNEEMGTNLLRLYEFAVHELREAKPAGLANARNVLTTVREGFEAIRPEAARLERSGAIPPVDHTQMVLASV
jgi:flagellar biosynthetic protein FliS